MARGRGRGRGMRRTGFAILLAVAALALLAWRGERLAPVIERNAGALDYAAELARTADYGALSRLELFELRARFRDKLGECLGLRRGSRPWSLRELPGRLQVMREGDGAPVVQVDLATLKAGGAASAFWRARADAPEGLGAAVAAIGLLGVFAPERPCPAEALAPADQGR